MGVIGGTLTGPLIFILPPLFYTKMLQLERIHEVETESLMSDYITETDLLIRRSQYGTVHSIHQCETKFTTKIMKRILGMARSDCTLSIVVISFGVCATLASTYYNVKDFKGFQLWSPCLQNISLSYEILSL